MQPTSKFTSKEALSFGWTTLKNNFGFFLSLFAGVVVIYLGFSALQNAAAKNGALSFFVGALELLLQTTISIGLLKIPLRFLDGLKADYGDLFSGYRHTLNYLFASLLYSLIVLGGLVLLVLPGVLWAIRFQFFGYLVVDNGMRPVEALRTSWAITKGSAWDLFTFSILLAVINIAGMLAFIVGLFITAPLSLLAIAFVYRKLSSAPASQPASDIA